MRKSHFIPPAVFAAVLGICTPASAQARDRCSLPKGYYRDSIGGCLHRYPNSVLQGLPLRWNECNRECIGPNGATDQSDKPPVYTLASKEDVLSALECDFLAASRDPKVRTVFSKAAITGSLTLTFVTKTSSGASLSVNAVPVFAGTSTTPSLEASRLTNTTQSQKIDIEIDPAASSQCFHESNNRWLTSEVMLRQFGQIRVKKQEIEVVFVLTTQGSAGLKIVPLSISFGPQVSGSYENTQKLSLTFDFSKKPSLPEPQQGANRETEVPAGRSADQPEVSQTLGRECVVNNPSGRPMNVRDGPRGAITDIVSNGKHVRAVRFASADNGQPWAYISEINAGREIGWVFFPYLTCPH